jgi:putative NADH-flavin reductase
MSSRSGTTSGWVRGSTRQLRGRSLNPPGTSRPEHACRHESSPIGEVDFTDLYAARDAFTRNVGRLAVAVHVRRAAEPARGLGPGQHNHAANRRTPAACPATAPRARLRAHPALGHSANLKPRKDTQMKLTIFGATGATGTILSNQALAAGHEVAAIVRDPARLAVPAHPRLRIVTANVMDPASIAPALDAADAVINAIGPRGNGATTVIRDSVQSIVLAMEKTGSRRFVHVSGSIVADEGESLYMRYLVKPLARRTFLRHVCADMRTGEDEIRHSNLDWTIMRPPSLNDKAATGRYRHAIDRNLPHGFSISRADLATCILALLDDPATVHRHVGIAY